ncbi:hypothetical protein C0995_001859 [Termitomyces sp. Mi166|nr:hypothetical protein C0995_001859 [Termitomyces sp. Mi166\
MPTTQPLDVKRLKQALPKPLIEVLKEPVGYEPVLFATSTKTTDVFASKAKETREALAAVAPKLTHIIPCPNLVRQLEPKLTEALKGISVQPGDRLSIRVDSKYTTVPLTRAIHSEKDSEDVFLGTYLYPALSLIGSLEAKAKLETQDSLKKYTNDDIMEYMELEDDRIKLYAASFGGAAHIADLGIYELLSNDEAFLHLLTEVKTPVAFPLALLLEVSPRLSSAATRRDDYDMNKDDMEKIKGWAIQFNWPGPNQNFGNDALMKHNKVISQVWNQMVHHKQRKDLDSGHLYMSSPCYPPEDGLVDIVIWTLKAAGYLEGDIGVPTVFDDWWPGKGERKQKKEQKFKRWGKKKGVRKPIQLEVGINEWTLPREALLHYNELTT